MTCSFLDREVGDHFPDAMGESNRCGVAFDVLPLQQHSYESMSCNFGPITLVWVVFDVARSGAIKRLNESNEALRFRVEPC